MIKRLLLESDLTESEHCSQLTPFSVNYFKRSGDVFRFAVQNLILFQKTEVVEHAKDLNIGSRSSNSHGSMPEMKLH